MQAHEFGDGYPDIDVIDRQWIYIAGLEIRPDRGGEVQGIAAAETAMHALALTQAGVGDLEGTVGRLVAPGDIRTEIDRDRGGGRHRFALEADLRQRQRAGVAPEPVVDEQSADIDRK